jgi:hypothetical protein
MIKQNISRTHRILGSVIALIQIFDIFIHVATNQVEPIRISSNIIILLWLTTVFILRATTFNANFQKMAIGSIVAYLVLNIIFLMLEGVTNEAQGGELRLTLFVLVLLTVTLSTVLAYLRGKQNQIS